MKRPRKSTTKAPKRSSIHDSDADAPVTKRPKRAEPLKPRTGLRRKLVSDRQPSFPDESSHLSDIHGQQDIQSPSELPNYDDSTELDPCTSSPLSNLSDENEKRLKSEQPVVSQDLAIDALAQSENYHPSPGGPSTVISNEVRDRILAHSRQVYEFKARPSNQETQAEKRWIEDHKDRLACTRCNSLGQKCTIPENRTRCIECVKHKVAKRCSVFRRYLFDRVVALSGASRSEVEAVHQSVNDYSSKDDFKMTDTDLLPQERDQSANEPEPEPIVPEQSFEESGPSLLLQQDPIPSSEPRDHSQSAGDMLDVIDTAQFEEFAAQEDFDMATEPDVQQASSEEASSSAVEKLASKEQLLEASNPGLSNSVDITQGPGEVPFEKEGEEAGASDGLNEPVPRAGQNETEMVHACESQRSSDHEVISEKKPSEEKDRQDTVDTPPAVTSYSTEPTCGPDTAQDASPPENNAEPERSTKADQELTIHTDKFNQIDVTDSTRVENAPSEKTYQGDLPLGAPEEHENSMLAQETKSCSNMDRRSEQVVCKDPSEMLDRMNPSHQGASECPQTYPRSPLGAMNVIVPSTGDNDEPPQEDLQQIADQSKGIDEHHSHYDELQAAIKSPMVDVVAEAEMGAGCGAAADEVDVRNAVGDLSSHGEPETTEPTMSIPNESKQAGFEMDLDIGRHSAESAVTPSIQFTEQLVMDTADEMHQLHRDDLQEAIQNPVANVAVEEDRNHTGSRMSITESDIYNAAAALSLLTSQVSLSTPIPAFLSLYSEPPSPECRRMPNSDAYDDQESTPRQNPPISPTTRLVERPPTTRQVNTTTRFENSSALSDILDRVWEGVLEMEVSARNGDLELVGGHSDQIHARLEEAREAALRISQRASQISRLASEL